MHEGGFVARILPSKKLDLIICSEGLEHLQNSQGLFWIQGVIRNLTVEKQLER